jgi:hypothetical protein
MWKKSLEGLGKIMKNLRITSDLPGFSRIYQKESQGIDTKPTCLPAVHWPVAVHCRHKASLEVPSARQSQSSHCEEATVHVYFRQFTTDGGHRVSNQ